jgi:hypothetical protein
MPPENDVPSLIKKRTAPDFLDEAAGLFSKRNAAYGASYRTTGPALLALFGGKIPEITTPEAAQHLYLMVMCLIKMKRYAQNIVEGHVDSAEDLMVYAAMLREATKEKEDDGVRP